MRSTRSTRPARKTLTIQEPAAPPYLQAAAHGAFVVDASVSAAWLLPDEANALTTAVLHATARAEVWVPALWLLEMANLLQNAQRRRRIGAAKRAELAQAAAGLRLQVCREPVALTTLDRLAAEHALTAYDACYLECALRRGLPLATQDGALLVAMARCGVLQPALPVTR
ncbi:MAG: type II toxin-antitoxin system VapC family toxin [Rubrivivax sp.]|nr:type II toxin-antitoxin system VapC family toxin [Rubrivivax sp.]